MKAKARFESQFENQCETPENGIESMLAFYRTCRAKGCYFERDGDMLLFQWGTYDWGKGEHFQISITRQLAWDYLGWLGCLFRIEIDQEIFQLSLVYYFEPTEQLRKIGSGNQWCHSPAGISDFDKYIRSTASFVITSKRLDCTRHLKFGSVE